MRNILLLVLVAIVNNVSYSQTVTEKLDQYFAAANNTGLFNGVVLVSKGENLLLKKGYGFRNAASKSPNNANTVFQIGSVTKQFTAVIILKLVEQGKLSLTDKLSKYFPQLPYANKITIENLLTHTSGIYSYTNDTSFMINDVEKSFNQQKLFDMIKDKPLDFEPGSNFRYNNSGYMLLGYIIEKETGKKYENVVREQIFLPLKMKNSGFDFTHLNNTNKAIGYNLLNDEVAAKAQVVDSSVSFAAGAIYSTTGDLYKWNRAIASGKILKKSSFDNLFKPRLAKYGLGLFIDTLEGKRLITHGGGIHGFVSANSIIPADSITVTIISNVGTSKVGALEKTAYAILYNKPYKLPEKLQEITLSAEILRQYEGEYEIAPTFKIKVTLGEKGLIAQATGQPEFELFAKSEKEFFLKVVDAQVEFVKNDKGEVEKLILHQNGQHIPGKKVK